MASLNQDRAGKEFRFPTDKRSQWLEELATKPDDLNLISGTHVVEGKSDLLQIVLCPPCMHCDTHTLKQNKNIFKRKGTQTSLFSCMFLPLFQAGTRPSLDVARLASWQIWPWSGAGEASVVSLKW